MELYSVSDSILIANPDLRASKTLCTHVKGELAVFTFAPGRSFPKGYYLSQCGVVLR